MPMFPNVQGSDLTGRSFRLPHDFEGNLNIALIVFTDYQQRSADTWLPAVKGLAVRYPQLVAYELPVVPDYGLAQRMFLDGIMRAFITDTATRKATITLYVDQAEFCNAAGLPGMETIYTLLVDRAGQILWRAAGVYTREAGADLESVIMRLQVV